jgi:hypothetical protein
MSTQLSTAYSPAPQSRKQSYRVGKDHYPRSKFHLQASELPSWLSSSSERLLPSPKLVLRSNDKHSVRKAEQKRTVLKPIQPKAQKHISPGQEQSRYDRGLSFRSPSPPSPPQPYLGAHPVVVSYQAPPYRQPELQLHLNNKDTTMCSNIRNASSISPRSRRPVDTDGGTTLLRAVLAHSYAMVPREQNGYERVKETSYPNVKRITRDEPLSERSDIEDWELAQQLFETAKNDLARRLWPHGFSYQDMRGSSE